MAHFDRRRLRRWASAVLGAWLFVVVAGIAHACALPSAGDGEAGPAVHAVAPPSPQVHEATSCAGLDGPGQAAHASHAGFCAGVAFNIPTPRLPSDPWSFASLAPPPVTWALVPQPTRARPPGEAGTKSLTRQRPVAILFLRLIL